MEHLSNRQPAMVHPSDRHSLLAHLANRQHPLQGGSNAPLTYLRSSSSASDTAMASRSWMISCSVSLLHATHTCASSTHLRQQGKSGKDTMSTNHVRSVGRRRQRQAGKGTKGTRHVSRIGR